MEYQVFTLPNGIRLLYKPVNASVTHTCIIVNAGSRDEADGKDGLAHFIEHLLFKKTEKRNTRQILNYLEAVGGDLNAYTTKEYTCIHASILNPYLNRALDLFEDLVFHSTFPQDELEKEKGVILDEIASYQDQPEEAIQDDFEDLLYAGHPLGRNILGTEETVKVLQRDDLTTFIKSNYNTEEIVVGVMGNYNFNKLCQLFTHTFGAVKANQSIKQRKPLSENKAEFRREAKSINQTHCVIGNTAYSLHDEKRTALSLLNNILGGNSMSSRLNLEIREKYGIAYTIESSYVAFTDTGLFSIYFGTDAEKAERALQLVHKELRKLRDVRLTAVTLEKAKKKFSGQIALGEENRLNLIITMSKCLLDYGKADSLEEVLEKVNAVTSDQIFEAANEVFDPAKLTTLIFEPGAED